MWQEPVLPARTRDMTCPNDYPLDVVIQQLLADGHESHHDDIDARYARNQMVGCTNCGGAGCFDYRGVRRGTTSRAFWSCKRCGHWIEV